MWKSCTWPTQAFVPYGPKSGTDITLKEWVPVLTLCPLTAPSQGHSVQKQFCPKSSSRSAVSVHSPPPPPRKSSFPRQCQSHQTRAATQYHEGHKFRPQGQNIRLAPTTVQCWLCTCMRLIIPPLKDKLVKDAFSCHQSCDFGAEKKIPKDE